MDIDISLQELLRTNFGEDLRKSYSDIFSSYRYSEENLPFAALYLQALHDAAYVMSCSDDKVVAFKNDYITNGPAICASSEDIVKGVKGFYGKDRVLSYDDIVAAMGLLCYKAVLNEKEPALSFCQLFVGSWCIFFT